jgi:glycosyltransferase involved in cell wall biosynthesis
MKIAIPVDSQQKLGGGFTFARNLEKGLKQLGVEIVENPLEADLALICGVTMITKETFRALRDSKTKVIVRLDNVPRNSRNRGSGTTRLQRFAHEADAVIWQGEWAKFYLEDFIDNPKSRIIHNGIDLNIFTPDGDAIDFGARGDRKNVYLYSRFSRDETKMWEVAWYQYQLIQRENKNAKLLIIGKFSDELREYNFDFFRGENFDYLGVIEDERKIAELLRSVGWLIAPYFNDAFSNTYLEALACGVELYKPSLTGGTPEMLELWNTKGRSYFSLDRMAQDYKHFFEEILNESST